MTYCDLDTERLHELAGTLESHAGGIEVTAARRWQVPVRGRSDRKISATVSDAWLTLQTPLPLRRSNQLPGLRSAQELLRGNAWLPEGMCYCLAPHASRTELKVDVPLRCTVAGFEQNLADVRARYDMLCDALIEAPAKTAKTTALDDALERAARSSEMLTTNLRRRASRTPHSEWGR